MVSVKFSNPQLNSMGRKKVPNRKKILNITNNHSEFVTDNDKNSVRCKFCDIKIKTIKESHITRHLNSTLHKVNHKIHELECSKDELKNVSKKLSQGFAASNLPLNVFNNEKFKAPLREIKINIKSSKTERKNCLSMYDQYLSNLKYKFLNKKIILTCDSSKINHVNYTILLIADFSDPFKCYLLDLHISQEPINAVNLKKIVKNSLHRISLSYKNLRLVVTVGASYNRLAFEQLNLEFPFLKWITCYSHLLGNIVQRIPAYYEEVPSLITKLNDYFSRSSTTNSLSIKALPKV